MLAITIKVFIFMVLCAVMIYICWQEIKEIEAEEKEREAIDYLFKYERQSTDVSTKIGCDSGKEGGTGSNIPA